MNTQNPTTPGDVYDAADNAVAPSRTFTYFGQAQIDIWFCILKNGAGSSGIYEIKYGGWNCKLVPDGCTDAFFPVK